MKAPEKIYMPNELLSEEWTRHIEGEDVEYVCMDVFLEKACKWLLRQEEMIGISFENDFIERFKKAMEE
mgnify:CR=1 FL=1|jgi:hypothetical protein